MTDRPSFPPLLKAEAIEAMSPVIKVHPLNPNAIRHTKSLSDAVGLSRLGIHLVWVAPGKDTSQFHYHHQEEEFIYILSGRGIAEIGDEEIEVEAGDFLGFTAPSLPHAMRNPFSEELVYLMGGQRCSFDVCDYPKLKKRLFRMDGTRQLVDWDELKPFQLSPPSESE